jgi:hypothetical protein
VNNAMQTKVLFEIGERVAAGMGDDRDTGEVQRIDGDRALIGWDSGVTTWVDVADLAVTDERWSGGVRVS